jgi:cell division inhibitor SepF
MGALRKAGVWLGLVEDDDDRQYDDADYDDFDEDELDAAPVHRPRTYERAGVSDRSAERGLDRHGRDRFSDRMASNTAERSTVRPIGRSATPTPSTAYSTRENLALAPQRGVTPRAVPDPEPEPRYQITTLHPTTFNEARTIGQHFRDGVPVIINLTELDEPDAKRIVDFSAGLAFGLRGTMERVTNRVFLLSPANIQVTAEDKARIAQGGFFSAR